MPEEQKGTGALLNEEDNRDIPLELVAATSGIDTSKHPKKNITNISMLTIEDQKRHGSCVGQAEGKDAEFQNFIETGKVTQLSKRALYAMCKDRDGNPQSEGTYPRIAAGIRVSIGVPEESLVDDNNDLPYSEYRNVKIDDNIKKDASQYRSKGYSFVKTLDEVKTAIDTVKAFNATLFVGDFNNIPVKPVDKYGTSDGTHRIWIFGYEDVTHNGGDTKIYFLNSWGKKWAKGKTNEDRELLEKGVGWFYWSDFAPNYIRDGIVYLDMPNELIDYARAQQFIFPRQLQEGMRGTDVMELQKRLAIEKDVYGRPCFEYPEFTTFFGPVTRKAVERYQDVKDIASSGTPETTGFGRVGPKTLTELNKPLETPVSSSLLRWADAIQMFEGWFPGSRSFRNNNPGNIKFIGQKRAIGSDGIFCIFATYEDGRQELLDLLTRAATGKSSIYYPSMTLKQFYDKYAPSSDNNNPDIYADAVAAFIGCTKDTSIRQIYEGV